MLNISHLYKSLLSKDIEININSKIENIKNANIWSDFNVKSACDKIDFTNLGLNDIKYHASLLENISKLSVDLLLDYDYYKDFIFKGQFRSVDYDDKLRMLGYEIEDDYWHNVRKPSRDTVIMNVFLSCLYNSIIEIMNDHFSKTNYDGEENFENDLLEDRDIKAENKLITEIKTSKEIKNPTLTENCDKIDTNIGVIDERECKSNKLECPESFSDLEERNFIEDKSQICTGILDNAHLIDEINIRGEIDKININNCGKLDSLETHNGKDETTCKNLKIFHDILNKNQNKWICKTCELLNQFNLVNCQTCNAHCKDIGYWICYHCSCVNEMSNDVCSACNTNNELIVSANKWKCWKPICNVLNDDKLRFCHKCGLQRTRPIPFSDLVERKVKGKINKFWICEKCWQYNNNDKLKCPKNNCGEPRFNQTSQITDKTNRKTDYSDPNRNNDRTIPGNSKIIMRDNTSNNLKESNETTQENHPNIDRNVVECSKSINVETEWKCWYKKCERMNKIKHNYCQTCKLDRNPPDPETQLVKCYIDNNIREIWICRKCEKHNPKDKIKCEGANCGSFRFYTANDWKDNSSQWECDKCTFVNNGKEKSCEACNSERNNDICQTASSWKCWFKNCRQTNDNQYKFCQHCKLHRFGNKGRGELVKCQDKDCIKEIWICQNCFKYNNLSNIICSAKNCDNSRF